MTWIAIWAAVKRFWPVIPCLALLIALLLTRASLASARHDRDIAKDALALTAANYAAAANARKASDLLNVERVNTEAAAISKETVDAYNQRIAALRADFAERVRIATQANSGSAGRTDLPAVPVAAERADATSCQAVLPARDALVASEQAEQLIALQAWVRKTVTIDVDGPR